MGRDVMAHTSASEHKIVSAGPALQLLVNSEFATL